MTNIGLQIRLHLVKQSCSIPNHCELGIFQWYGTEEMLAIRIFEHEPGSNQYGRAHKRDPVVFVDADMVMNKSLREVFLL
jgi:hypothetical protein